jgi:nicotinamide-nucleotide adenylyltransferase
MDTRIDTIAMIARWRPVHNGQAVVLNALCDAAAHARIGIGSANRYNVRNPFTFEETADMIRFVLRERDNYEIVRVDDLDDGPRWRAMVVERFGPVDVFVTDNPYVASLLRDTYTVVRPVTLVPPERRVRVDGTMVRRMLAQGGDWRALVPSVVAQYMIDNGLDVRFRREFGLQALALDTVTDDSEAKPGGS